MQLPVADTTQIIPTAHLKNLCKKIIIHFLIFGKPHAIDVDVCYQTIKKVYYNNDYIKINHCTFIDGDLFNNQNPASRFREIAIWLILQINQQRRSRTWPALNLHQSFRPSDNGGYREIPLMTGQKAGQSLPLI